MNQPDVITEARALLGQKEGVFYSDHLRRIITRLLAHCAAQEAQIATLRQALSDVRQGWTEAKAARLVEAEAQIAALRQELDLKRHNIDTTVKSMTPE